METQENKRTDENVRGSSRSECGISWEGGFDLDGGQLGKTADTGGGGGLATLLARLA